MPFFSRLLAATFVSALAMFGAASASTMARQNEVKLRALDKITGRATDIVVKTDAPVTFGSLRIDLRACFQAPPEEVPESAAFLRITSTQPVAAEIIDAASAAGNARSQQGADPVLFSGWMYASSPGLNALEHPVYDVWVIRCTAPSPVSTARNPVASSSEPFIDDIPAGVTESEAPIEDLPTYD
jgi:hypothetical protein